jgi:hypothetical protein
MKLFSSLSDESQIDFGEPKSDDFDWFIDGDKKEIIRASARCEQMEIEHETDKER